MFTPPQSYISFLQPKRFNLLFFNNTLWKLTGTVPFFRQKENIFLYKNNITNNLISINNGTHLGTRYVLIFLKYTCDKKNKTKGVLNE